MEEREDLTPVLWHSNAPWVGTGYGSQTALHAPEVAKLGYKLAFSAFYGLRGSRLGWVAPDGQQFVVYPGGGDVYGNDVLGAHTKHWFGTSAGKRLHEGILVTLTDPWVLSPQVCGKLPTLAWTPVDHYPLMPRTDKWLEVSGAIPLAMSEFGRQTMVDAGHDPLYVPHAFDPDIFYPVSEEERREIKKEIGVSPDTFLVGMVAANKGIPSRKNFAEALGAFAALQARAGKDVALYLHTQLEADDGENIRAICRSLKVHPIATDQYALALGCPPGFVARAMCAFDVLMNPAQGEGFGVPLAEAQACGTPCLTTDFSAMPEVAPVARGNWTAGGQSIWTPFESYQVKPSVEALADCLIAAYEEPEAARLERRQKVADWAYSQYRIEAVAPYWRTVLNEATQRLVWREQAGIEVPVIQ